MPASSRGFIEQVAVIPFRSPIGDTSARVSRPNPAIRFRRAGLDGHDGVEVVVLAGKQSFGFEAADVAVRGGKFLAEVLQQFFFVDVGFAFGELDVRLDVARERFELLVAAS